MKLILCVFFMLISAKECDNNKTQVSNDTSEVIAVQSEKKIQEGTKITYQAATRGFFLKIWIEGDSIMTSEDNTLKAFEIYPFPTEEKETFFKLFNDIDKKGLSELEAPSKKFQYDAAPMAWLEVSEGEESYKTMTFDHGEPPKAILKLIEKILSLKTMVEKH